MLKQQARTTAKELATRVSGTLRCDGPLSLPLRQREPQPLCSRADAHPARLAARLIHIHHRAAAVARIDADRDAGPEVSKHLTGTWSIPGRCPMSRDFLFSCRRDGNRRPRRLLWTGLFHSSRQCRSSTRPAFARWHGSAHSTRYAPGADASNPPLERTPALQR